MKKETCRGAFSKKILEKATLDKEIIVVCTDSRGSASLGKYPEILPDQFVEMGIAEQNAITVSAGMASMGKKVFAVGPASFYSMRAAEQIKVDLAYSHNNVKVIGISGGISYGALGATHHSVQDIALMRAIPDLIVEIPSDASQMEGLVESLLETEIPAYIRIGRGEVPLLYERNMKFAIGEANKWGSGTDIGIVACGQMVWRALEAKKILEKKGIEATVLDMHTIKPLDKQSIRDIVDACGCILTVEEHSIYGGLGGAIAEYVAQYKMIPITIAGIPDTDVPNGTDEQVFEYLGLTPEGIANLAEELINKKE